MQYRQLSVALAVSMCVTCACGHSRRESAPDTARTPVTIRLHLRCEPKSELLQCEALASDDAANASDEGYNVTDAVEWTTSDTRTVVVQRGRVRAARGSAATVTATWTTVAGAPSASVMVLADVPRGDTRQAYVLEGEVRMFPSADGVPGARVSLIDENGIAMSVTSASGGNPGLFRFGPIAAGTYRLRAVCDGYRAREEIVVMPDNKPQILTLLPEPRNRS
jgi:hypothetical protein